MKEIEKKAEQLARKDGMTVKGIETKSEGISYLRLRYEYWLKKLQEEV